MVKRSRSNSQASIGQVSKVRSKSLDRLRLIGLIIIFLLVLAAYSPSIWDGTYLFDDHDAVANNAYFETATTYEWLKERPEGNTLSGRPFLYYTFGLNAVLFGHQPTSYLRINVLIHIACGIMLYLIILRAFAYQDVTRDRAVVIAISVSLLWSLHPINSQAVAYIVQRGESLATLFILFSLYAWDSGRKGKRYWLGLSLFSMFMGIATKEVAWFAPLMPFLWEWAISRRDPLQVLKSHPRYFMAAFSSWVFIAWIIIKGGTLDRTFSSSGYSPWEYFLTQPEILTHYLRLFFWPYPQQFDYDWQIANISTAWPYLAIWVCLFAASCWLVWKRPWIGLPAAVYFLSLSATSSFNPLLNLAYEHRMYLASACLMSLLLGASIRFSFTSGLKVILPGLVVISAIFGTLTFKRATLFQNEWDVWEQTLRVDPDHRRALTNLGGLALQEGRPRQALDYFRRSERIGLPDKMKARVYYNMGNAYLDLAQWSEAIRYQTKAVRESPEDWRIYANLGIAYMNIKDWGLGAEAFLKAYRLNPENPDLAFRGAFALAYLGEFKQARSLYQAGIKLGAQPPQALTSMLERQAPSSTRK
jgi:tetratricopeptide (TPR) repeat protein